MAELKDFTRMCNHYSACGECPAFDFCYGGFSDVDKIDELVTAWCKEHPRKTYVQDFLEKFPNARVRPNGYPYSCKDVVYGTENYEKCRRTACLECWNEVMPDA